jgi:DNA-binding ferritin-like protein
MKDIEELYKEFQKELRLACWSFYTWKNINNIAVKDKKVYHALNRNVLSWNIILYSLQNTFFIVIGRLFDIDGKTFSIHKLLKTCIENINQFSKDALRERKIKSSGTNELSWLDEYIEKSYQPNQEDFLKLKGEVSKRQKRYELIYKPIRHKVFAHKEFKEIKYIDRLFKKAKIGEIQDLLCFLYQIERIIFQLLYNGDLMNIGDFTFNEEELVMKDITGLLDKIK